MDNALNCYSCDYEQNIRTELASECAKCPDMRNYYGVTCVPKCPADKPLRGFDNKCYACDSPERVLVTNMTDACYECADERKLENRDWCVLK